MLGKKLARLIKKMTNQELYAFVAASVLELERRSGDEDDVEKILSSIYTLTRMMRKKEDNK